MKTLEQEFAQKVYELVSTYEKDHDKNSPQRKQYGSMAQRLPILVRTAGLAEAMAFVANRKKEPPPLNCLLEHLAQVVLDSDRDDICTSDKFFIDSFVKEIGSADMPRYIYLTHKTMLALKWFKRFSQSVLEVEITEEGGTHD